MIGLLAVFTEFEQETLCERIRPAWPMPTRKLSSDSGARGSAFGHNPQM
jgi:hypothetical protein